MPSSTAEWVLKEELLFEINAEPPVMLCRMCSAVVSSVFLSLTGEVHVFEALDSDPMLVNLIDAQCPVGGRVELKLGAQVSVYIHVIDQIKWHKKNVGISERCIE